MKIIFIVLTFIFSFSSMASNVNLEDRLNKLEQKIDELEKNKISNCKMEYKYYTSTTSICPNGTLAKEAHIIGNDLVLLKCYYYQLQCTTLSGKNENLPIY